MKKPTSSIQSDGLFRKYKELIITTIICLFLTGIYDSINNQTAEIKKWYELMIGINEKVKVQADNLSKLEESLETHVERTNGRFSSHNKRIRTIEFEVLPYRPSSNTFPSIQDTTLHVKDH